MKELDCNAEPAKLTRRDAMKRIALRGAALALAPVLVSNLVAFASDEEEVIRYSSLADPNEKTVAYSDFAGQYTSLSSNQYGSQASSYGSHASNQYSSQGNQYASRSSYDRYSSYAGYGYSSSYYNSFSYSSSSSSYNSYIRYSSFYSSMYNSYFRYMSFYSSVFTGGRYNNTMYMSRYNFHANMLG